MVGVTEPMQALLRDLALSVAGHRKPLDELPARQQEMLRAMDAVQRQFFMEELAKARAEAGRGRFRASLERWQARREAAAGPDAASAREAAPSS